MIFMLTSTRLRMWGVGRRPYMCMGLLLNAGVSKTQSTWVQVVSFCQVGNRTMATSGQFKWPSCTSSCNPPSPLPQGIDSQSTSAMCPPVVVFAWAYFSKFMQTHMCAWVRVSVCMSLSTV